MFGSLKCARATTWGAALLAVASLALAPGQAQAAKAFGTLTFDQPTGVVGPTDTIDVWATLTLDAGSDPIEVVGGSLVSGFLTDAELEAHGFDPTRPLSQYLGVWYQCTGNFTDVCSAAAYEFQFAGFEFKQSDFLMQPGESLSFLYGQFVPQGAGAPPGDYIFHNAIIAVTLDGFKANGDPHFAFSAIGQTCITADPACSFQRTVTGVPEPATWAMLIAGFGFTGATLRRRSRAIAA